MADAEVPRSRILSRIAAGVIGGYAFVWGFTTLLIALALTARLSYLEVQTTAYLVAFLLFLAAFLWAFLWAFSARRVAWVWSVLGGGGALMALVAWYLTSAA